MFDGPGFPMSIFFLSMAAMGEVQERLDFAERVIARPRDDKLVGPGEPR